tara:strand:- start:62 stop:223 length:162 start_codon:yes stop_codon:yes gene_type:complete
MLVPKKSVASMIATDTAIAWLKEIQQPMLCCHNVIVMVNGMDQLAVDKCVLVV